jgi:cytochrome oxidase Cu insertion factor (SCO1/SenC/PrrC family)
LAVQENKESERQSELDLFTHSSLLVLVDSESRLRGTYESMGTNTVATIIADLDRL